MPLVCPLQTLWLQNNKIGETGVTALANVCAGGALASLEKLDLERNQIGDVGVSDLADACAGGALAQLENIFLSGNPATNQNIVENALKKRA